MLTTIKRLNAFPFNDNSLHVLGYAENWPELRRIIHPIVCASFSVTNGFDQALIDDTRRRFDVATGDIPKRSVLQKIARNSSVGAGDVVELLLSVGVDPDRPAEDGWHPSPSCAHLGNSEVARSIFLCRPDMKAKNLNGDTPLAATRGEYKNDEKCPERPARRMEVAGLIENSGFETAFPSIGELASKRWWFAVKNLMRRQVVSRLEFEALYCGKTALDWAQHFEEQEIAAELRYYASLPSATALDLEKEVQLLRQQLEEERDNVAGLALQCAEKDQTISELSETLAATTSRLEEVTAARSGSQENPSKKRKKDSDDLPESTT